jgi:hypothetical protein
VSQPLARWADFRYFVGMNCLLPAVRASALALLSGGLLFLLRPARR